MSVEDFTSVIDANLTSAFIGCREFLKQEVKRFWSCCKYIFNCGRWEILVKQTIQLQKVD